MGELTGWRSVMIKKAILVSFLGSVVMAQAAVSPYISLSGGLNFLQEDDFSYDFSGSTGTGSVEFDSGFVIEGAVGLAFDNVPVRAEIELSWQKNDVDQINFDGLGSASGDGDQRTVALMWNGYFDIKINSPFTPYILAGFGSAKLDEDIGNIFAYQLGAGVGYALNKNMILDFKYKYFMTEDYDFVDGTDKIEADGLVSHQLQIGVRYQF
jgi:opacity protein-like surface antigen